MKPRVLFNPSLPWWWVWFWSYVQTADFCAASAHFFSGIAVVLAASLWMTPWIAAVLFIVLYAAPKELIVDAASWGEGHGTGDWWDLLEYAVGDVTALGILLIRGVPL